MITVALVVKLTAKAGQEGELSEFLAGAVDLANQEAGTTVWFALQTDTSTFGSLTLSRVTANAKLIWTGRSPPP